ncbi:hypothetical protein BKA70DRAFT_1230985 [Coprinopsis sp. MPI-PUGE-AT-0042]|nr:hypothetical protein BKA70DRAFT_1230985 [Coprinopsis sp. MPI-PUGE-AT-0042]
MSAFGTSDANATISTGWACLCGPKNVRGHLLAAFVRLLKHARVDIAIALPDEATLSLDMDIPIISRDLLPSILDNRQRPQAHASALYLHRTFSFGPGPVLGRSQPRGLPLLVSGTQTDHHVKIETDPVTFNRIFAKSHQGEGDATLCLAAWKRLGELWLGGRGGGWRFGAPTGGVGAGFENGSGFSRTRTIDLMVGGRAQLTNHMKRDIECSLAVRRPSTSSFPTNEERHYLKVKAREGFRRTRSQREVT